jgi:hypothetical protein
VAGPKTVGQLQVNMAAAGIGSSTMAVAEKSLIAGFHYPFPSFGHVEKDGTSYRLVPIAWNPSI